LHKIPSGNLHRKEKSLQLLRYRLKAKFTSWNNKHSFFLVGINKVMTFYLQNWFTIGSI